MFLEGRGRILWGWTMVADDGHWAASADRLVSIHRPLWDGLAAGRAVTVQFQSRASGCCPPFNGVWTKTWPLVATCFTSRFGCHCYGFFFLINFFFNARLLLLLIDDTAFSCRDTNSFIEHWLSSVHSNCSCCAADADGVHLVTGVLSQLVPWPPKPNLAMSRPGLVFALWWLPFKLGFYSIFFFFVVCFGLVCSLVYHLKLTLHSWFCLCVSALFGPEIGCPLSNLELWFWFGLA